MSGASPSITDWLTAIGTVGAVIVALLIASASILKKWIQRPILTVDFENKPPFARPPTPTMIQGTTPGFGYFMRLRVTNTGKSMARDVEGRLMRVFDASTKTERNDFDPTNLHWAGHTGQNRLDIHKTAYEFIDLAYPQTANDIINIYTTETEPRGISWGLPRGDYIFDVVFFGKNTEPVERFYLLKMNAGWIVKWNDVTLAETDWRPARN